MAEVYAVGIDSQGRRVEYRRRANYLAARANRQSQNVRSPFRTAGGTGSIRPVPFSSARNRRTSMTPSRR